MALSQQDRLAFSLSIVSGPAKIATVQTAKAQVSSVQAQFQSLDTANNNLFIPVNTLINTYQLECAALDGNVRTTIVEQDIQDAANRKLQNHFFPNDTSTVVPSLSALHNIWSKLVPYALGYGIGKSYTETYGTQTKESDLINTALSLISSATAYQDIENTSGQHATQGQAAHCSNNAYDDQTTCEANGGTWFPSTTDSISSYPVVVTLKTNLVNAINAVVSFLGTEVSHIVTNDKDTTRQTQNNTAIANINSTFLPALSTWLAYPDFNPVPGSVTTYAAFYAYNSALLAPTKLHSTQLAVLSTALNNRLTFLTTRTSQVLANLGSVAQDVNTGNVTPTGLYGQRYGMLSLRLHALTGSLTQLTNLNTAVSAQDATISGIQNNSATYATIIPSSLFQAPANGTNLIHVVDSSFLNPGDAVYVASDTQEELQRAVKSVNGTAVTLNDIVPAKYRPNENGRIYKDKS